MAGPTVEELLQAGGQRRKPPAPPQVGAGETFVNRAVGMVPGANRLTDAIAALALESGSSGGTRATLTPEARAELQRMGEDVPEDPGLVDRYREVRDRRAERTELGSQQNPWAGRTGALTGFGLSLFAPLPKASGTGLGAAVKTGAGYGAFQGLTEGGADLTRGEFGDAAGDVLKGAAFGGALGAGFHGAMRLGQRGVQALRGARQDVLAQETAAAQEAAQKGQDELAAEVGKHRELVGKARGMMEKDFAKREAAAADEAAALERQHGQALEANKVRSARESREAERAAMRERDIVGRARELNKRYDAKRAAELERDIADLERAAEAERKMVGSAREMNKARDARDRDMVGGARELNKARDARDRNMVGSAREMDKRVERVKNLIARARYKAGDGPAPEPSTKILEGMHGKAEERRALNYDRVRQRQKDLQDPELPTNAASENQAYIDRYGHAVNDPARFRREFIDRYIRQRYGDEMADRLMRERIGPGGEVLPRAAPQPPMADEATKLGDAFDAAARGEARTGGGGSAWDAYGSDGKTIRALPEDLPGWAAGVAAMRARVPPQPSALGPIPVRRMASPAPSPQEPSMAAPRDAAVPPVSTTRTATATQSAEVPTVPGRPSLPVGAPQPAAPPPAPSALTSDVQDVTRLAGPGDVAPLAAERAAAREQDAFRAVGRAGYEGVKAGKSTLGAVFGGLGGITREALRDPAVKARVLAAARLHVLSRINPALYARVGAQLQAGGQHQRAAEHLLARKDPEYREARQKAAEQVAAMTDQQLVELFSQANSPI